jgi:RHS repeat-associated protein
VKQKNGSNWDVLQSFTYDSAHRPLTSTDAALQTTTFTYRSTGDIETVVTPARGSLTQAQRTTTFSYYADIASLGPGRVSEINGPISGDTTEFTYDSKGRVETVTESDGYSLETEYDDMDRPTRLTYPDGTYEEMVYANLDLARMRDRQGRWTRFFYDANRRLASTRDASGRVVQQEWTPSGMRSKLIDASGSVTRWDFDAQNRVISETRADNSETLLVYEDTTSRLKRRTDARGQHTDYAYFLDNALDETSYPNAIIATPTVNFTYDTAYPRIATMVDGIGMTSYAYHAVTTGGTLGATQLSSVDGPFSNDLIGYTYDELGRSLSRSINGVSSSHTYDGLGRMDSVTNVLGTFNYTYVDQTSRPLTVSYPNGQTTSFTYLGNTTDRRLSEIHHQLSGGATLSKFNYTYDTIGNITTWTQQRDNGGSAVIRAYDFTYDAIDQLASAIYRTTGGSPTVLKRYVYTYDAASNRTNEQMDDNAQQASYNNMNRLTSQGAGGALYFAGSLNEAATVTIQGKAATVLTDNTFSGKATVPSGTSTVDVAARDYAGNLRTSTYEVTQAGTAKTFTYDDNGNLTDDGTRTFEWDAENRLSALEEGTHRSEFTYDGHSRRNRIVEKDNGSTTSDTVYLWCGLEICEERDSTGGTTNKRYFPQGEQQGTDEFFYTHDHLGSIRELTDNSASAARYDYDPYGRRSKLSGSGDTVFGFTGHLTHEDSELVLALFRAYDPEVGRWISSDPIGLAGGLNLYAYVSNYPAGTDDPLGLQSGKLGGTNYSKIPGTDALPSGRAERQLGVVDILAKGLRWFGEQKAISRAQERNLPVWPNGEVYQGWETQYWYPPDPRDEPPTTYCPAEPVHKRTKSPCNTWPKGCWYPAFPPGVIPPPRPADTGRTAPEWMR